MLINLIVLLFPCALAETVFFPAGTFQQGSGRASDEPIRTVHLSAYRLDSTEVSIADFQLFVEEAWTADEWWSSAGLLWRAAHPNGAGDKTRAAGRAPNHPVVAVTYWEAEAYCSWRGGALPTEAQWEHAACGEGGQRYPWGDNEERNAVWYSGGKFGHLTNVRTRGVRDSDADTISPTGLHHMAGNVWEWTADVYHRDGTIENPATNPTGPIEGPWRVLRGGSFMNLPSYCSCTHREPARPERQALTTGFRCAYSAAEPSP